METCITAYITLRPNGKERDTVISLQKLIQHTLSLYRYQERIEATLVTQQGSFMPSLLKDTGLEHTRQLEAGK